MAGSDDEVTPAGWYRQPDDPELLRWWDGDDWTDDTMPVPEVAGRRTTAKGTRKATGGTRKASAVTRTTGGTTPRRGSRPTEPTTPRRTRRDAMAEAEAELQPDPSGSAAEPIAVEVERDPGPGPGPEPVAPLEPVAEDPPVPASEPEPEQDPVRGQRSTAPGGPGYIRPVPPTVRVLADPAAEAAGRRAEGDGGRPRGAATPEDWSLSAWSDEPSPIARPRPDAGPGPVRRRPPAQEPRPPQVERPSRPRPASPERPPTPARRPQPRPAPAEGHRPSRMAAEPSPATAAALLRVTVRAALIAVVLGVAWLGYVKLRDASPNDADTLSQDPVAVTVDPDAPRLDQIILTLADLPRGWSSQARNPSNGDLCQGRVPESVIEPTATQSAAFTFAESGAVIGNTIHEFANDDTAGAYLDLAARVLDSCREQTVDGATTHLVPLEFPAFGDDSFVAEITGEGSNASLHGAIVYVRHDNRVASIVSFTLDDEGLDTELVEHLVDLVARRMASKPAISSQLPGESSDPGGGDLPGG